LDEWWGVDVCVQQATPQRTKIKTTTTTTKQRTPMSSQPRQEPINQIEHIRDSYQDQTAPGQTRPFKESVQDLLRVVARRQGV
jgi:hypothetical protein